MKTEDSMNYRKTIVVIVASFVLCGLMPSLAFAADSLTVGPVTASNTTVDVPIYIRDVSGTPLGVDQPAGSKIQAFSIKVTYAPASSVQSVTIGRAGITAGLSPAFESKPSTSNSISILDTFQEATDPIPFTLNAGSPGNLVAHMVFTLSASAAPGSSITLTLDPSVTQLSDSGGSPATKETVGNSRLTINDGAINIPNLTITLSPSSRNVNLGSNGGLTAIQNISTGSATTVTLSSSNTTVAKVPPAVSIPAGSTLASFAVTGSALGTATITATLANNSTSTSNITVVPAPIICNAPPQPVLSGPSTADAGVPYTISWSEVTNATEYILEESTDPNFATIGTSQTLTTTSAPFTHSNGNGRYYYRLRAHNHGSSCDLFSEYSTAVSVLISPVPVPLKRILVVVGSLQGGFGSFFKTAVQLYNPKDVTVSGKLVFHVAGASGSASDPSMTYSIAPKKTQVYADLLPAMGIATGLGSADIIGDLNSPLPVSLVRVFNDGGPLGTTGLAEEQLSEEEALQPGNSGVLIAPADISKFRLSVGIRTLASPVALTITVRDKDGNVVKTLPKTYDPTFFDQPTSSRLLEGYVLAGGETLTFAVTSGSVFIYGSTTDNATQDPSVQFAKKIE
jgi:hypothetical protein